MRPSRADRLYLPLFFDLTGKQVLIVGGGKAAWQKVQALAAFGPPITVVSPLFVPELRARAGDDSSGLRLITKSWSEDDLEADAGPPVGLILACTADFAVQDQIVAAARARGIPVLDAARPEQGDFIQPAVVRSGTFTLAVSSGGVSPGAAVAVRNALAEPFDEATRPWRTGSPDRPVS